MQRAVDVVPHSKQQHSQMVSSSHFGLVSGGIENVKLEGSELVQAFDLTAALSDTKEDSILTCLTGQ